MSDVSALIDAGRKKSIQVIDGLLTSYWQVEQSRLQNINAFLESMTETASSHPEFRALQFDKGTAELVYLNGDYNPHYNRFNPYIIITITLKTTFEKLQLNDLDVQATAQAVFEALCQASLFSERDMVVMKDTTGYFVTSH